MVLAPVTPHAESACGDEADGGFGVAIAADADGEGQAGREIVLGRGDDRRCHGVGNRRHAERAGQGRHLWRWRRARRPPGRRRGGRAQSAGLRAAPEPARRSPPAPRCGPAPAGAARRGPAPRRPAPAPSPPAPCRPACRGRPRRRPMRVRTCWAGRSVGPCHSVGCPPAAMSHMISPACPQVIGPAEREQSANVIASAAANRRMRSAGQSARRQRLEPVAVAAQQRQLLDPAVHRQMLALDDARDLLGLGRAAKQAERDVRLERLACRAGFSASWSSVSSAAPSDGSA